MTDRLNFSDYTAEEQIKDVEKTYTPIFVFKSSDRWKAVLPRKRNNIIFEADRDVKIGTFIEDIREDLINLGVKPQFRCAKMCDVRQIKESNTLLYGKRSLER